MAHRECFDICKLGDHYIIPSGLLFAEESHLSMTCGDWNFVMSPQSMQLIRSLWLGVTKTLP